MDADGKTQLARLVTPKWRSANALVWHGDRIIGIDPSGYILLWCLESADVSGEITSIVWQFAWAPRRLAKTRAWHLFWDGGPALFVACDESVKAINIAFLQALGGVDAAWTCLKVGWEHRFTDGELANICAHGGLRHFERDAASGRARLFNPLGSAGSLMFRDDGFLAQQIRPHP